MSEGEGHAPRRTNGIIGNNQAGGSPRQEPWRDYAGWKCTHCGSGNTIIETYPTGPEGYCLSCTREQKIPKDKLDAYYEAR